MKVEVNQKVDGVGNELYMITYTDTPTFYSELFIGNGHKDVLLQFFKRNDWDEEFINSEYSNVNWVFSDKHFDEEDWDEDEFVGEGFERIEVELIGEVIQ
jgi:hypothetical protein